MNIGAIGIDSSHLPEFTRRIKEMNEAGKTRCKVTHFWDPGNHEWQHPDGKDRSAKDVAQWKQTTLDLGAKQVGTIGELLAAVDGVMVLNINGHRHLELAVPSLVAGKPTYIDKPLTCSPAQAQALLNISRQYNARAYSASSLRFIQELETIDREKLGKIVAIDAYGAGELQDLMPGLWHYGCHSIEMVDAIWGPGVKRVSAVESPDRHLVDLDYHDGRYASIRLERKGAWAFGAVIHGEKGVTSFAVDFAPVYTRLVAGMVKFFEGGPPPCPLKDIVETVGIMHAGNQSIAKGGDWVNVPVVV